MVIARKIGLVSPPQHQEPSVQNKKSHSEKCRKDRPLQADGLAENVAITERVEPEGVHVIRQRRPTAEKNDDKDGKNQEKHAGAPPRGLPVDDFGHESSLLS